jgi:hypothetical protein
MSAESREKAEENGQKSGKGSELVSKAVKLVTGSDSDRDDDSVGDSDED